MKRRRAAWVAAATLSLLLIAAPAFAHVTIETDDPAAEAVARYLMRVPNESDTADTVEIEVQLPPGFGVERTPRARGWDASISDGVLTLSGGRIPPGDFDSEAPTQEATEATSEPAEPTEPNSTLQTAATVAGLVGIALALGAYALGRRGRAR